MKRVWSVVLLAAVLAACSRIGDQVAVQLALKRAFPKENIGVTQVVDSMMVLSFTNSALDSLEEEQRGDVARRAAVVALSSDPEAAKLKVIVVGFARVSISIPPSVTLSKPMYRFRADSLKEAPPADSAKGART